MKDMKVDLGKLNHRSVTHLVSEDGRHSLCNLAWFNERPSDLHSGDIGGVTCKLCKRTYAKANGMCVSLENRGCGSGNCGSCGEGHGDVFALRRQVADLKKCVDDLVTAVKGKQK